MGRNYNYPNYYIYFCILSLYFFILTFLYSVYFSTSRNSFSDINECEEGNYNDKNT